MPREGDPWDYVNTPPEFRFFPYGLVQSIHCDSVANEICDGWLAWFPEPYFEYGDCYEFWYQNCMSAN